MKNESEGYLVVVFCIAFLCAPFLPRARAISSVGESHFANADLLSDVRAVTNALRNLIQKDRSSDNESVPTMPNTPAHTFQRSVSHDQTVKTPADEQSPSASVPGQSSTLLPNGLVLLLGGEGNTGPVATALIKDLSSGDTTKLPQSLAYARAYHTATLLPDGTVMVLGGIGEDGNVLNVAEAFDPATLSFRTVSSTGLVARAHDTATLLTDGLLFIAGGVTKNGEVTRGAELWNYRTNAVTPLSEGLLIPRRDQTATLLASGAVLLWGGADENGMTIPDGEIFDPTTDAFRIVTSQMQISTGAGQGPEVEATIPEDGQDNVSPNTLIVMRFSEPLHVRTVNADTVSLSGPQGTVATKIVPAEGGMLAFVTPTGALRGGTSYTLSASGPADSSNNLLQKTSFSFTTTSTGQPNTGDTAILGSTVSATWPGGPQNSPWKKLPPLQAPPGVTAISGQVLLLDGSPLPDVTLRVGTNQTRSDGTGRFLLQNVPGGNVGMVIDGRSANKNGATYCVFEDRVVVAATQTNVLSYTIWMPVLDVAHQVTIPVPTAMETVVTNPLVPGLEFHVPAGTTITDIDGKVTNKVSITPIPVSQPPFPLPSGVNVPVYFTIQPGGGWITVSESASGPTGGWIVYPNSFHEPVGTRFDFWNYEPHDKGWYIYGQGSVSSRGQSVVPDPGVVIYALTGAMIASSSLGPSSGPNSGCGFFSWLFGWCHGGEPIDLGTGLFVYQKTDLYLRDLIPINLTRTYRPNDGASRSFGVGTTDDYDIFLVGNDYTYIELVMPDGARIHYPRVSSGTSFADAVFQCNSAPGPFFESTIDWNGNGWTLTRRDGIVYKFHDGFIASTARQGTLLSITDRNGNTLTVTRDSNFNATQITSPDGRWIQLAYDTDNRITQAQDNIGRTVQYFYDSGGRLNKVIDMNGGTWLYNYDSNNNMTSLIDPRNITYLQNQYDSQNRVVKQILADGVSTYQIAYNPGCVNNCTAISETDVTDPNGSVKKVTFNPPLIFPNSFSPGGTGSTVTLAAGTSLARTFTYQYQPGTSLLTSMTDPLSRTTSYTYDPLGNLTSLTRLSGTPNAATTSFAYQPKFSQVASITDPLSHTTFFSYDSQGNLISTTDPLGNTYGLTYNPAGEVTSVTDPLGETTNFAYDSGDLASVTDPLGRTTTFFIDSAGRLISRTDALGQVTKYTYNAINQFTQITDPLGGVTSFSYDGDGNLLSITDPRNTQNPTVYTYDDMDRLQTRTEPLGNRDSYQYDGNGNLTQFTDGRGEIATFTYDSLNRRTFVGFGKSGSSYQSTINYAYDAGNRLTQVIDSITGTITRGYDGLDRLTSEATSQGSVSYTYDAAGHRSSMAVPGQPAVSYTFDAASRLTQIAQGTSTVSFTYDGAGRRSSLTLPNGITANYSYDIASDLSGINYQFGQLSLGNLAYSYDNDGHRVAMSGSLARTGIPQPVSTTAYNAANQLTQWGPAVLSYDANGNMLTDGTNTFTWDARNRLASMNSGFTTFQYDPFGRRVAKTTVAGTTNYLYDGVNPVQELSGGAVTANLLTGTVDEYLQRTDSTGTANFLTDALGSTIAVTDNAGNTLAQYTYEPFGNTNPSGSSANANQFTGRENDGNGFYFYRARYYNPTLGRFISQDPIGFAGGVNLYAYVTDNPTGYVDPFGFSARGHDPARRASGGNPPGSNPPNNPPNNPPPTNNNQNPGCGNAAQDAMAARNAFLGYGFGMVGQTTGLTLDLNSGTLSLGWDTASFNGVNAGLYPGSPGGPTPPNIGSPSDIYFTGQTLADLVDQYHSSAAAWQAAAKGMNDAWTCASQ